MHEQMARFLALAERAVAAAVVLTREPAPGARGDAVSIRVAPTPGREGTSCVVVRRGEGAALLAAEGVTRPEALRVAAEIHGQPWPALNAHIDRCVAALGHHSNRVH